MNDEEAYEFYADPENRRIVGPAEVRQVSTWSSTFGGETTTVNSVWPRIKVTLESVEVGGGE